MNRAALFVAGGIPRCRLSPETFITARRPLGITNVFDGGDDDDRADGFRRGEARFAESEIHIGKKKAATGRTATRLVTQQRKSRVDRLSIASFLPFVGLRMRRMDPAAADCDIVYFLSQQTNRMVD